MHAELKPEYGHQVELYWRPDVPAEIRAALEPYLQQWSHLAPTWCHQVIIAWDPNNTTDALRATAAEEYRWVRITAAPGFLGEAPTERSNAVIHELVHGLTDPLCEMLDRLIGQAPKPQRALLREQKRRAMEGVVCDITRAIEVAHNRGKFL